MDVKMTAVIVKLIITDFTLMTKQFLNATLDNIEKKQMKEHFTD